MGFRMHPAVLFSIPCPKNNLPHQRTIPPAPQAPPPPFIQRGAWGAANRYISHSIHPGKLQFGPLPLINISGVFMGYGPKEFPARPQSKTPPAQLPKGVSFGVQGIKTSPRWAVCVYAWFVASGTVTATGMNVTVQSEGGIMIRSITETTNEKGEAVVTGGAWGTVADSLTTTTTSLYPTSTINLTSWVHASSAHADNADAAQDAGNYKPVATNDVSKYRRLDTFAIRSSSGQNITEARIKITEVSATATNETPTTAALNKAVRVGVRVDTTNGGRAPASESEGSAFYVYAPNLAGNFTLTAKYDNDKQLVEKQMPGASDYIYMSDNTIPGAEAGVRVEIFTWYEGEDENCKNTSLVNGNTPLTPDNLKISVKFTQDKMPTPSSP